MADAVASKVIDFVKSFGDAVLDAQLVTSIGTKARKRAILGGNETLAVGDDELVGSPFLKALYDNKNVLLSSSGLSHVLYAPSSVGKTTALIHFMKHYLEEYKAPAIMVSGHFPGEVDYLTCMASSLEVPWKDGSQSYGTWWVKSLLAGLLPKEGETLQHAPVLILDEFNSPGPSRHNILFAESLSRFIYKKKVSLIFVTQNETVARDICLCNAWRKVGPFPGFTTPDRVSDPLPPPTYEWKTMTWTHRKLTQLINRHPKYQGKFQSDDDVDANGNYAWLRDIKNPTTAIVATDIRLANKIPEKAGAVTFKAGFFDP